MWLPETAVDMETLEVLAEVGMKFTILAPHQARRVRRIEKEGEWVDVSGGKIDPTMAYLFLFPSGKTITLFFYDGPISQGDCLRGPAHRAEKALRRDWSARLTTVGDGLNLCTLLRTVKPMATTTASGTWPWLTVSSSLNRITWQRSPITANISVKFPPTHAVEIVENSSWSCAHGVERWRNDCGCNSGMRPGWNQQWRKPLRDAMDGLRDNLVSLYEWQASKYLKKPWEARDHYIDILLDRSLENIEDLFSERGCKRADQRREGQGFKAA